jgi:hypothetical protein
MRVTRSLAAVATAMTVLNTGAVCAQDYVRADCKPFLSSTSSVASKTQGRWYRRFWTGDCDGLFLCVSGSPNWNEIAGKLVARAAATDHATVRAKACSLGQLIGLEWSRGRRLRRIDTADLRGFKAKLDAAPNVLQGLEQIEASARAKIGTP